MFEEALTEVHKKVVEILEVVRIEEVIRHDRSWKGRPAYDWVPFARFFVAKAILNVASTRDMIAGSRSTAICAGFWAGRPERDCPTNRHSPGSTRRWPI
jgi:hypothetical protein